jgi:hypothetical protein
MTVGELLSRISSYELTEWIAFYQLEHEDQEKAERDARRREGMR